MVTSPRWSQRIAWVIFLVGAITAIGCLSLMGYARFGSEINQTHRWKNSGSIYLTSTIRGSKDFCTIIPEHGQQRQYSIPTMPNRGPQIAGAKVSRWFEGTAEVQCSEPTIQTVGFPVQLYMLVEQPLALLAGVIMAGIGLQRLGVSRISVTRKWASPAP